jgi:hypothetical protein
MFFWFMLSLFFIYIFLFGSDCSPKYCLLIKYREPVMTIKLHNPYLHLNARFNYLFNDCGHTFEEIIEIELNNSIYGDITKLSEEEKIKEKEDLRLLINHCFVKATD